MIKKEENKAWMPCADCKGRGMKNRRLSKKLRQSYELALAQFAQTNGEGVAPAKPKGGSYTCPSCGGIGLAAAEHYPIADTENYPQVAIIGAGIGGVALAVACLQRGIPFTLYERDNSFDARAQGYGLTLQQATKAIEGLGIMSLAEGLISTRHLVHNSEGKILGEWGVRKWLPEEAKSTTKRTNRHIARQALRLALLEQLGGAKVVQWGHQLIDLKQGDEMELSFEVEGVIKKEKAALVVGADGIRSAVRSLLIVEERSPLRYLGCIVILGICKLDALKEMDSSLLDSATVFQTANGHERIYMMPFSKDSVMWQLSFPMSEQAAQELSAQGAAALKEEAFKRTQWHSPIPQIMAATAVSMVSGYPVYDRALLEQAWLKECGAATLIGDAAHPMSPFKGQGANQALLDALALARAIATACRPLSNWRAAGIRETVLTAFEKEMLARSATKVKDSAAAAAFLHTDIVLQQADEPRGRSIKRKAEENES